MSSKTHPRGGVETRVRKEPGLQGANPGSCLPIPPGAKHRQELFLCADEATFWKEYFGTQVGGDLIVGDQKFELGPQCRPEPETIAKRLLDQPGSVHRILEDFGRWLQQVATPREIVAVMSELQRTPA